MIRTHGHIRRDCSYGTFLGTESTFCTIFSRPWFHWYAVEGAVWTVSRNVGCLREAAVLDSPLNLVREIH